MKKIFSFTAIILIASTALIAQSTAEPEKFNFATVWKYFAIGIPALYEFLTRIIPTAKDYTVIGKIIKLLKWISDKLNYIPKK